MVKQGIKFISYGCVLLLTGCNVGSEENQSVTGISSQVSAANTTTGSLAKPAPVVNESSASAAVPAQSEVYQLVVHGVNSVGQRLGTALQFQKTVMNSKSNAVELIWFEPARAADGSCLRDLAGYDVVYSAQASATEITVAFDLASRDLSCTAVGATECGDVRECRYQLTL